MCRYLLLVVCCLLCVVVHNWLLVVLVDVVAFLFDGCSMLVVCCL